MRKISPLFVLLSLCLSLVSISAQVPGIGGWSFDFDEDDDYVYLIPTSNEGEFEVEFYISNSYLVEIEVEITVDTPFGAELLGEDPFIVNVGSGSNKSDSFKIGKINLFQSGSPGGSQEDFRALATLIKIGGIDVSATNDWKDDTGTARMPRIHDLKIGESAQTLEYNPDIETRFSVEITNHGNLDDQIGHAEVSDDCPLMTVSIAEDSELSKIMKPQIKSSTDSATVHVIVQISPTHPSRNCDVELRISSGGSGEGNDIVWAEESFRISVLENVAPPPDESDNGGPINEPIVTEQNLPTVGIPAIVAVLFLAFFVTSRE